MPAPDYAAVSRFLAVECEAVVEALASEINWESGEMHARFPSGLAVVVAVRGAKRGVWLDKSDMSGGDMLELVHRALGQDDHRVALDWGKRFLGLPDDARQALADRRQVTMARQVEAADAKAQQLERVHRAIAQYVSGSTILARAPEIDQYLRGRGIPLAALPGAPKTLRFAPAEYHREAGRELPAMLAPIIDPLARCIIAVHRTFLALRDGAWTKAPVEPAKKVSGPYKGGIIPLLRGASGKPLALAPEGETVMIAEGIENALAAALILAPGKVGGIEPAPRVFAAISAPNLPHIRLPQQFAEVILIHDNDPAWHVSVERAYSVATRRWLEAGLAVRDIEAPPGFKDFAEFAAHD